MDIIYVPSDMRAEQGTYKEVRSRYDADWRVRSLGEGNGNWLVTRGSDVLVNGKSYRDFVLTHYSKRRLTENIVNKFRRDVESGKIEL